MQVYPLPKRWGKIRPFLNHPDVLEFENAAFQCIHPEYEAGYHIPREGGWTLDLPFPRTRTSLRAYQSFGRCHQIAPVMLRLMQLAEPKGEWWIEKSELHTVVMGRLKNNLVIVDINLAFDSDADILDSYFQRIATAEWTEVEHSPESYLGTWMDYWEEHHRDFYPMSPQITGGEPMEGWEKHYPHLQINDHGFMQVKKENQK